MRSPFATLGEILAWMQDILKVQRCLGQAGPRAYRLGHTVLGLSIVLNGASRLASVSTISRYSWYCAETGDFRCLNERMTEPVLSAKEGEGVSVCWFQITLGERVCVTVRHWH